MTNCLGSCPIASASKPSESKQTDVPRHCKGKRRHAQDLGCWCYCPASAMLSSPWQEGAEQTNLTTNCCSYSVVSTQSVFRTTNICCDAMHSAASRSKPDQLLLHMPEAGASKLMAHLLSANFRSNFTKPTKWYWQSSTAQHTIKPILPLHLADTPLSLSHPVWISTILRHRLVLI